MADESTIRDVLVAYSAFTALIGGASPRLWDQVAPTNRATPITRPFVTMLTVADVPERALASAPGMAAYTIQFDIYADSKAAAKAVLAQLRNALNGAGYYDSEEITRDLPADDPALRRISSEWRFLLTR